MTSDAAVVQRQRKPTAKSAKDATLRKSSGFNIHRLHLRITVTSLSVAELCCDVQPEDTNQDKDRPLAAVEINTVRGIQNSQEQRSNNNLDDSHCYVDLLSVLGIVDKAILLSSIDRQPNCQDERNVDNSPVEPDFFVAVSHLWFP